MSPSRSSESQRGVALIEAMIGMVLAGLIATGSVYALARASKNQNASNLRSSVVEQIRAQVIAAGAGLCGSTTSVMVGSANLAAVYTCTPYTAVVMNFPGVADAVSVDESAVATRAQIITATVTSPLLGGALTVSTR
jgi:Tfp pilus assembly protein PilV